MRFFVNIWKFLSLFLIKFCTDMLPTLDCRDGKKEA